MKSLFFSVPLAFLATPSLALTTQTSTSLSCPAIHAVVQRDGAALLRYRSQKTPGLTVYDRVVADPAACQGYGFAKSSSFPSADGHPCDVMICVYNTDLRP